MCGETIYICGFICSSIKHVCSVDKKSHDLFVWSAPKKALFDHPTENWDTTTPHMNVLNKGEGLGVKKKIGPLSCFFLNGMIYPRCCCNLDKALQSNFI